MPLSNASSASLRSALAWLGVRLVATPFLYDSFIHYFTPVYPDAIQAEACPAKHSAQFKSAHDGVGLVLVDQRAVHAELPPFQTRQPIQRRCDAGVEKQQLRGIVEQ